MNRKTKILTISFLVIILFTNITLGLNKKPKPILPKAKTNFSANIPSSYTQGAIRGSETNLELIKELESKFNQVYITPDLAKVFIEKPLFEWSKPICSQSNVCKVIISDKLTESTIAEIENVKENSFLLDTNKLNLTPGNFYLFRVQDNTNPDNLDLSLQFYVLSNPEKSNLTSKINSIGHTKQLDDYSKGIEDLNFFAQEGLWFDLINKLNNMLIKYPNDVELKEFKNSLYKLNKE